MHIIMDETFIFIVYLLRIPCRNFSHTYSPNGVGRLKRGSIWCKHVHIGVGRDTLFDTLCSFCLFGGREFPPEISKVIKIRTI